ncbi:MAG: hypothetical protein US49_C0002G0158 [candidate division TM6 bacterium GW2011_GWF2_37_49]|nr:MAG: hypothetical protein US49_C0002G0158 [candidate division TM6 bacterium GW2011_GWF2_37_49]
MINRLNSKLITVLFCMFLGLGFIDLAGAANKPGEATNQSGFSMYDKPSATNPQPSATQQQPTTTSAGPGGELENPEVEKSKPGWFSRVGSRIAGWFRRENKKTEEEKQEESVELMAMGSPNTEEASPALPELPESESTSPGIFTRAWESVKGIASSIGSAFTRTKSGAESGTELKPLTEAAMPVAAAAAANQVDGPVTTAAAAVSDNPKAIIEEGKGGSGQEVESSSRKSKLRLVIQELRELGGKYGGNFVKRQLHRLSAWIKYKEPKAPRPDEDFAGRWYEDPKIPDRLVYEYLVDCRRVVQAITGVDEMTLRKQLSWKDANGQDVEGDQGTVISPIGAYNCFTRDATGHDDGLNFCAGTLVTYNFTQLQQFIHQMPQPAQPQQPPTFKIIAWSGTGDDDCAGRRKVTTSNMQADPANRGALFMEASNFNYLEAKAENDLIGKAHDNPNDKSFQDGLPKPMSGYAFDKTQGPDASLSAAAGTIFRLYYYFKNIKSQHEESSSAEQVGNSSLWPQKLDDPDRDLNSLKDLRLNTRNGYIISQGDELIAALNYFIDNLLSIRVGVQCEVQVSSYGAINYNISEGIPGKCYKLFHDPHQKIMQMFVAALNLQSGPVADLYKDQQYKELVTNAAKALLRVNYDLAIMYAYSASIKKVILTKIGGGTFKNDSEWIKDVIAAAVRDNAQLINDGGISIILNSYSYKSTDGNIDYCDTGLSHAINKVYPNRTSIEVYGSDGDVVSTYNPSEIPETAGASSSSSTVPQ